MLIRSFKVGDEPVLRSVFYSSVHDLTGGQYSIEKQMAWDVPRMISLVFV